MGSNTRPVVITDKNGKVTTVHKGTNWRTQNKNRAEALGKNVSAAGFHNSPHIAEALREVTEARGAILKSQESFELANVNALIQTVKHDFFDAAKLVLIEENDGLPEALRRDGGLVVTAILDESGKDLGYEQGDSAEYDIFAKNLTKDSGVIAMAEDGYHKTLSWETEGVSQPLPNNSAFGSKQVADMVSDVDWIDEKKVLDKVSDIGRSEGSEQGIKNLLARSYGVQPANIEKAYKSTDGLLGDNRAEWLAEAIEPDMPGPQHPVHYRVMMGRESHPVVRELQDFDYYEIDDNKFIGEHYFSSREEAQGAFDSFVRDVIINQ
jgi:hypothetical protein